MNNGGPTALIIDRGDWTADMDFVGHKKVRRPGCGQLGLAWACIDVIVSDCFHFISSLAFVSFHH